MANPNTDAVILQGIATTLIATPNTTFAAQGGAYFIEDEYALSSSSKYPVLHLMSGTQAHMRKGGTFYEGTLQVIVKYYNRFDLQGVTIDAVRRAIRDDLNLMKDYLLGHDTLDTNGEPLARGIPHVVLSPYRGELEDIPGIKVVSRTLACVVDILEYDVP